MISCLLNIDWNAALCFNPSAAQIWMTFSQILWSAVEQYVPSRTSTGDRKDGNVQSEESHTNCGNVLRENANYGINYTSRPMILICVVNTEKVYIFGLWRVTPR